MRVNILHSRLIAAGVVVSFLCTLCLGFAGPQDENKKSQSEPGPSEPGKTLPTGARDSLGRQLIEATKVKAVINKMIAEYDLKPHPLPSIPDDPPPHERAMISLPHVVEPPDLIIVELLEGLPGRPISGERLVRPDGKISLGFYGEVEVRGLTLEQVRVAIIKHLRKFLDDATLGLTLEPDATAPFYTAATADEEGQPVARKKHLPRLPRGNPFPPAADEPEYWAIVPPAESGAVFVDITSYNSQNYYVDGDAQIVGKMPWTGNETVLDAIEHGGGLLSSAELKDIRLVRPGNNGTPPRIYKVDLEAIRLKGDVASNYQIFAGDRLVIGRNAVVSQTTEIDRLVTPLQTVTSWNLQYAFMLRALQLAGGDSRDELLKELVDFWSRELARGGHGKIDDQELRNALIRKLRVTPPPINPDGR
jgi:polysaccharide export outer membrane protein